MQSARGQALKTGDVGWYLVKRLAVCRVYGGRGGRITRRIIQSTNLEHKRIAVRQFGQNVGAAGCAKAARHGVFEIGTREFRRSAGGPAEPVLGHHHEIVWSPAREILAFPTVALCLELRCTAGLIGQCTAIATAGKWGLFGHGGFLDPDPFRMAVRCGRGKCRCTCKRRCPVGTHCIGWHQWPQGVR